MREYFQGKDRYMVSAKVICCGSDLSVTITGGDTPHVGAVALGCFPPEGFGVEGRGATVSVVCALDHRDDVVARDVAKKLATVFKCNVSITVGVHLDDATPEEIRLLVRACDELCDQIASDTL